MNERANESADGADLHTLTGAYAMNALPDGERELFERHLAACPACAQEVRELTAAAGRLGSAVSVEPPPEMKARVLRHVATVRQEPPRVPGRSRTGGGLRGRWAVPRFVLAACLAAAAGLGGVAAWQYQAAEDARTEVLQAEQRSAELARVLMAPDARTTSGELGDGATGTVVMSRSEDRAAFLAAGMPELPGDKVYQLWFDDGGKMRSAGLLDLPSETGAVLLEGGVGEAAGMGITVEPTGGSPQPTSDPLAVLEFGA